VQVASYRTTDPLIGDGSTQPLARDVKRRIGCIPLPAPVVGETALAPLRSTLKLIWSARGASQIRYIPKTFGTSRYFAPALLLPRRFDPNSQATGDSDELKMQEARVPNVRKGSAILRACRRPFLHCSGAGGLRDGKQRLPTDSIGRQAG